MTEFENAYVNAKRILKYFYNKPPDFELSVGSLLILEGYRQYVLMCEELEAKGIIILPKGSRGEFNLNDEGGSSGKERES